MNGDWLYTVVGLVLVCATLYLLARPLYKMDARHAREEAKRAKEQEQQQDRLIDELTSGSDFEWTRRHVHRGTGTGIAIDKACRKVCVFNFSLLGRYRRVLDGSSIVQVDIVEDGSSVLVTRKTGTVGRAIKGGILLGATGAIVGATSASSRTTVDETVNSLELHLLVDDIDTPRLRVTFLTGNHRRDSQAYRNARARAEHYHSAIQVLMHRANIEDELAMGSANSTPGHCSPTAPLSELATQAERDIQQSDETEAAEPEQSLAHMDPPDSVPEPDVKQQGVLGRPKTLLSQKEPALAGEIAASLQQINQHILRERGAIRESEDRISLRWRVEDTGRDCSIDVVYINPEQVAINGVVFDAVVTDIRRGLAECLAVTLGTQSP